MSSAIHNINLFTHKRRIHCLGVTAYRALHDAGNVYERVDRQPGQGCHHHVTMIFDDAAVNLMVDFKKVDENECSLAVVYCMIVLCDGSVYQLTERNGEELWKLTEICDDQVVSNVAKQLLTTSELVNSNDDEYYRELKYNEGLTNLGVRGLLHRDSLSAYTSLRGCRVAVGPRVVTNPVNLNILIDSNTDSELFDAITVLRFAQDARAVVAPDECPATFAEIVDGLDYGYAEYADADVLVVNAGINRHVYVLDNGRPLLVFSDGTFHEVDKFEDDVLDVVSRRRAALRTLSDE